MITYNSEITSFRSCYINTKLVDVKLTFFWRRYNMANLGIITTPFWHRDAGGIAVRGYTGVFICLFYKGKKRLFYKPSHNLQRRNNEISRLTSILTLSWRRCNVANLDIITTSFRPRDTGEIEVRGYTCVFICRLYKRKQSLFYQPSDNLQCRNNVISMLLYKYKAGCRQTDVVLTSV